MLRNPGALPLDDMARLRCLPDPLTIQQIVLLWAGADCEASKIEGLEQIAMEAVFSTDPQTSHNDPAKEAPLRAEVDDRLMVDVIEQRVAELEKVDDNFREYGADPRFMLVRRDDLRQWLEREGFWPLPAGCLLSNWWPEGTAETRTASDKENKAKRTRKDRLTRAIEATLDVLGNDASADAVFSHLAERDTTGIIVDSTAEKIVWEDTKGSLHDTTRKSLANRLTKIRFSRQNPV